ncbi:hypothetical protein SLS60_002417 [Paraconiothyrium brasiliense]|uniref:Fungal STAND N-terminal Goodbye domain-containing protein n=1 Tax=Paraconiothyrium brasiliense TaxID=300254 RepID=A0ABR3S287_9PLEO
MREFERSGLPLGDAAKEDASMETIWAKAQAAFEAICGESLKKGEVKSFKDVQSKIETTCDMALVDDPKPEDKWDVAKSAGLKSLQYMKILVGFASQASSLIPMPAAAASLTSTALCFVFDIPQTIKGYDEAIDNVFSEVASALSQFYIYRSMDNPEPVLVKQIHMVLVSFVKICAHVVKYRQGRKRDHFREKFKVVFAMNTDLKDELSEFKRLVQAQREVEGTVTLAVLMETQRDLEDLIMKFVVFGRIVEETHQVVQETQKGVKSLTEDSDRTRELNKIRDTLQISSTVLLDTTTTRTCSRLASQCLEDTGSWIWEHEAYESWTTPKGKDVLVVSGSASSGKTVVSARITKRLEEQRNRTYVAHYFFPANTKKSDDDNNSVQSGLKYMAFQIARVDNAVRKALYKVCDTEPALFRPPASLEALWKGLRIGASGSNATYYLVFDGIENLPESQREMLLKFVFDLQLETLVGRVRMLVSGTDELFSKYRNTGSTLWIRMEEHNQDDMRIVIQEELKTQQMLQNARPDSDQDKAKSRILERLPEKVNGSYSLLRYELERVMRQLSKRTALQDLDQLLDQSTSSYEAAIRDLELSLTTAEIAELNEILKWVLWGVVYLTLAELESAMVLFSDITSLTSLEHVIRTKYLAVLKLENGRVYVQEGVEEYLRKNETVTNRLQRDEDKATISMTISINNVDQELCGNFLWDLTDMAIRNQFKFNFDSDHFTNLHSRSQRTISVNRLESNYDIVSRAFKYLSSEPMNETQDIGAYLVTWLPEHLHQLRKLEEDEMGNLRGDQKSDIGRHLCTMFKDDTVFRRHKKAFQNFCWAASEIKEMQIWVTDSTVIRKVDKKWRNAIRTGGSNPIRGYLKELVRIVVRGLVRGRDWDVANARDWVKHFMSVDENTMKPPPDADTNDTEPPTSFILISNQSVDEITNWEHVSTWCQEVIGISDSELDALWYERLAEASLSQAQDHSMIISLYRKAIGKTNPSWRCYRGLGETYHLQGLFLDAITQFELALDRARQENADPTPEGRDITEIHLKIGQSAYDNDDMGKAVEHFSSACNSEVLEQATQGQLGRLKAALKLAHTQDIMQTLKDTFVQENEESMVGLVKLLASDLEYSSLVIQLFQVAKRDSELLHQITRALEMTTAKLKPSSNRKTENHTTDNEYAEDEARGVLQFIRGMVAYKFGVSKNGVGPVDEALHLWAECRDQLKEVGGRNANNARLRATVALAKHYFHEITTHGSRKEHFDTLTAMWKDDCDQQDNACKGFLAALHVKSNNREEARKVLLPDIALGLQILTDDQPENDTWGFSILALALAYYQDFENAVIALSLRGSPDMVSSALRFTIHDLANVNGEDKQHVLDMITKTAEGIIAASMPKGPDSSEQKQRLDAATAHLESLSATVRRKEESRADSEDSISQKADGDSEALPNEDALQLIKGRLENCTLNDDSMFEWSIFCDGCTLDRIRVGKRDSVYDFFHCVYCPDTDFCGKCLARLRDPESDVINVCSPKHQWLLLPTPVDSMYVGPRAEDVRRPIVKAAEDDAQVLVASYADDSEMISVKDWKQKLAKEWDVPLPDQE